MRTLMAFASRMNRTKTAREALTGIVLLLVIYALYGILNTGWQSLGAVAGLWALASVGINLAWGYGGMAMLGQNGLVAIGAFTTAVGVTKAHIPWLLTVPIGMAISAAAIMLISWRLTQLKEIYFGIVSVAIGVIIPQLIGVFQFTGGESGIFAVPKLQVGSLVFWNEQTYYIGWALAILLAFLFRQFTRTPAGLGIRAGLTSPDLAASVGVKLARGRLIVLGVSAAIGALAGSLFINVAGSIYPAEFTTTLMLLFPTIAIVGGLGTTYGAVVAALGVELVLNYAGSLGDWQTVISGVLMGVCFIATVMRGELGRAVRSLLGAGKRPRRHAGPGPVTQLPVGADAPAPTASYAAQNADSPLRPAVRIESLSKSFGGVHALRDISMEVSSGAIHGLMGANGAGKTTLIHALTGIHPQDTGSIEVLGHDTARMQPYEIAALGVRRTFQIAKLAEALSEQENAALGAYLDERNGVLPAIFGFGRRGYHRMCTVASGWLAALDPEHSDNDDGIEISAGRVRMIELARASAGGASLLVLDEPCSGLTVSEKQHLGEMLRRFVARGGTVLIVEHDIPFISEYATEVTVLDEGQHIFSGSAADALSDERVMRSYLGDLAGTA